MNCLLLREVPFPLAVRLWDTYVAEGGRMKEFLTYVLAAFLLCWAPQLRAMDFQARWRLNSGLVSLSQPSCPDKETLCVSSEAQQCSSQRARMMLTLSPL